MEWSAKLGFFVLCEKTVAFGDFSSCGSNDVGLDSASPKTKRRSDVARSWRERRKRCDRLSGCTVAGTPKDWVFAVILLSW